MSPPRTQPAAIDLLAWLLAKRYLLNTGFVVGDVLAAIGATRTDLDAALARVDTVDGLRLPVFEQRLTRPVNLNHTPQHPSPAPSGPADSGHAIPDATAPPAPAPAPSPSPSPSPSQKARTRPKRKPSRVRESGTGPLGEPTLKCSGPCAQWLPVEAFVPRTDRPGMYTARCRECRRQYQAARHVKVAVVDALDALGVRFHLDTGSNIVGLECAVCGDPFQPGDDIHGTIHDLTHDRCTTQK